jgi:hypothetical protein
MTRLLLNRLHTATGDCQQTRLNSSSLAPHRTFESSYFRHSMEFVVYSEQAGAFTRRSYCLDRKITVRVAIRCWHLGILVQHMVGKSVMESLPSWWLL